MSGTIELAAPDHHTVRVTVEAGVGSVEVRHRERIVWGQYGTPAWALSCAAEALAEPGRFRRWNLEDGGDDGA